MSVLTLAGKPINWAKPPKATTKCMWSQKTIYGQPVYGSLRSIAHLDRLNSLAIKKFGVGIRVIQSAYNSGVAASKGTHDYSEVYDVEIPGVSQPIQQRFFRANGGGGYARTVAQGFTPHIHYMCLPESVSEDVSQRYRIGGFKVGYLVDGGWSLYGKVVASSQIADYYSHHNALAGHAADDTWFPPNIDATIFDLDAYIAIKRRQQEAAAPTVPDLFNHINSHGPLARLGPEGVALWAEWQGNMLLAHNRNAVTGVLTLTTSDTNKHGVIPNFGPGFRRIGGKGIDLVGVRPAKGSSIQVLKRKVVDLHIDGHNGHGVKVRVTMPSGKRITFWLVQANIGRGTEAQVLTSLKALRKTFGKDAVYGFDEIDEGDTSDEHGLVAQVFPETEGFTYSGWKTLVPVIVGPMLAIHSERVTQGCPGHAKITPRRDIVNTTLALPRKK